MSRHNKKGSKILSIMTLIMLFSAVLISHYYVAQRAFQKGQKEAQVTFQKREREYKKESEIKSKQINKLAESAKPKAIAQKDDETTVYNETKFSLLADTPEYTLLKLLTNPKDIQFEGNTYKYSHTYIDMNGQLVNKYNSNGSILSQPTDKDGSIESNEYSVQ